MADIDQIIAGGAGASSRANFDSINSLPDAFYKARDQKYQQEGRDLFKGGIPTTPDGQPDFAAMGKALFQHGDVGQGVSLSNLDIQRQQLKAGQQQSGQIRDFESGGSGQAPVLPPSASRTASTPAAAPLSKGGLSQPPDTAATGNPTSATLGQILTAQNIPNDQIGSASASLARQLGLQDPNQPINPQDPQIRNVLAPAISQLKRMGIGQVVQGGQPQAPGSQPMPQQPPQGQPLPQVAPQPVSPQVEPQGQPSPVTNRLTSQGAPDPSRVDKAISFYMGIMTNPMSPKANLEAAKTRLEALQKSAELTPSQKEYSQAVLQGYKGTLQDFMADNEAKKTAATEEAKLNSTKYQTIVDNGTKAQQEIPQLQMLQEQMNDPNFFSGVGEKYNLLYKRLKSAVGIDPNAAVPQEFLRKATAANVLSSLGALKGLGQIRVAEINMAREAASSPDNSIPANKLLTEISIRSHQRNADIAELAQAYKEKNGSLDAGFDKLVTKYGKEHPLFNDAEIKDWGLSLGRAAKGEQSASASPQKFSSPADVHAAVAAGKLKKGDSFQDANGVKRYVP